MPLNRSQRSTHMSSEWFHIALGVMELQVRFELTTLPLPRVRTVLTCYSSTEPGEGFEPSIPLYERGVLPT